MGKRENSLFYKTVKFIVRVFYPVIQVEGTGNLPGEPAIIVGNHTQMNGPIACELYFPGKRYIWCASQMMHLKEVPDYAYQDFWSRKPKAVRWVFRLLSYLIAPISVCIFTHADTIEVCRDRRIISTFKETEARLSEGADVIIFPEYDKSFNPILYDFQEGFVDIAKLHYKRTGRQLSFVPLYIAPALKKMYLGRPITFCAENPLQEERKRICDYLKREITEMACSLPPHRVVPYRNVPKKEYPMNILHDADAEKEVGSDEKAGS